MTATKSIVEGVASFGGAATVGAALGWGVKKLLKVLMVVLAAITVLLAIPIGYLSYEGVLTINWDRLYGLLDSNAYTTVSLISGLAQSLAAPAFGGFATGFALGFQRG